MSETCWHSKCALGDHGTDGRRHETATGQWFYAPVDVPAPVDWPARLRKAADVADRASWIGIGADLRDLAFRIEVRHVPPHVVEAIGRALTGDEPPR